MEVLAWTFHPSPQRAEENDLCFVPNQDLLENSDVISLHLRLSDETRGFLKKEDFDLMKPSAFIVNTAGAGLIESGQSYNALRSKKIAGAALDVFDQEPLLPGDPITGLENFVITPHNAGMTPEAIMHGLMMAVNNVGAFLAGKRIDPFCVVAEGSREP
jgi:phosphoglycerate dehydrogenase-like enzyme